MIKEQITSLITHKHAQVGVIGLGYVGLPLLAEFAGAGFKATGFEVDANKAAQINSGGSYIGDVTSATVKRLVDDKLLTATRFQPPCGLRRAHHLRSHTAPKDQRARCLVHPGGVRRDPKTVTAWTVDHSGVDHLSGHHQ